MNTISDAELADFLKNKAVRRLNVIQNDVGKYLIVVTLTWKKGDWKLITTRGKPREWASLDRLTGHIREQYDGMLPTIVLILRKAAAKPEAGNG